MKTKDVANLALSMKLMPNDLIAGLGQEKENWEIAVSSIGTVGSDTTLSDPSVDQAPNSFSVTTAVFSTETKGANIWQPIVGVVVALVILLIVLVVCLWFGCFKRKKPQDGEEKAEEMEQLNWQSAGGGSGVEGGEAPTSPDPEQNPPKWPEWENPVDLSQQQSQENK